MCTRWFSVTLTHLYTGQDHSLKEAPQTNIFSIEQIKYLLFIMHYHLDLKSFSCLLGIWLIDLHQGCPTLQF